jgi:hypothetical protein
MEIPMAESQKPSPASQQVNGRQQEDPEPLTDAQRNFAKLLGRLLAQRWSEEQRLVRQ